MSFESWLTDSAVPHIADAIGVGVVCQLGTLSQDRNSEGQLRRVGQGRDNAERLKEHKMAPMDMWLREFPGSGRAKADIRRSPDANRKHVFWAFRYRIAV